MFLGQVPSPRAWLAPDISEERWRLTLKPEIVRSLEDAARDASNAGITADDIRVNGDCLWAERSPQVLSPALSDLRDLLMGVLNDGPGFAVLSRLPVEKYTDDEAVLVFWALCRTLGTCVTQNALGEFVCEVRDYKRGAIGDSHTLRGFQTREALPFHTDSADVVGLLALTDAASGGSSLISSSLQVHNELVADFREYLGILYSGVYYDARDEQPSGSAPVYLNPIFGYFNGHVYCRYYLRHFAESAVRHGFALTQVQREAMDIFESIAASHDHYVTMTLTAGDLQFVNNNSVLHARGPFHDNDATSRRLLRTWINPRNRPPLPAHFAYARDGFPVRGTRSA